MVKTIYEEKIEEFNKKHPKLILTNDKFLKVFFYRNIDLLKELIISILDLKLDINKTKLKMLNTMLPPSSLKEYLKTVDFIVLLNDNVIVNLEFNNMSFTKVKSRNYIYFCKLITTLLKSGNKNNSLMNYKIYQININANNGGKCYREVKSLYVDNYQEYVGNVKIVEINLESLKKLLYTEERKTNKKEYLLACFKADNIINLNNILEKCVTESKREKIVKEVMIIMEDFQMIFTEEEAKAMDAMMMEGYLEELEEKKQKGLQEGHKQGLQEGHKQGLREGHRQGLQEGHRQGLQEGNKQKALEIAKNLLKEKISIDIIKRVTGLSDKTIKSLML